MNKIKQVVSKIKEKLRKKSFWLPESLAQKIEKEGKSWDSESVFMTHMVKTWFEE